MTRAYGGVHSLSLHPCSAAEGNLGRNRIGKSVFLYWAYKYPLIVEARGLNWGRRHHVENLLVRRPHIQDRRAPLQRALDRVGAMSQRLPEEPRAKVAEIIGAILELIPQAGLFPPGSRDLFVLQRTATEYLPTSVDAYLALPASYATTAVLRDGRTALQILGDQLDLLDVEVGEIGDAVRHRDSERLLVHGRFLEQVFGRGSNELELPPPE